MTGSTIVALQSAAADSKPWSRSQCDTALDPTVGDRLGILNPPEELADDAMVESSGNDWCKRRSAAFATPVEFPGDPMCHGSTVSCGATRKSPRRVGGKAGYRGEPS
jgi:hypothetical protein